MAKKEDERTDLANGFEGGGVLVETSNRVVGLLVVVTVQVVKAPCPTHSQCERHVQNHLLKVSNQLPTG